MIKSDQNHSYIFVSRWQYAFLANYQFFQSFAYTHFILGDRTASTRSARFCRRFGGEIINSLNSLNGANSTCPAHPESYRRRFSPRSGIFRVDAQT
jgi:hypothetical protein